MFPTAQAAVDGVRAHAGLDQSLDLVAVELREFPEFWYVTVRDAGQPSIGGIAFVVHRDKGQITQVSGSKPPRVNCAEVRQLLG